MAIYYDLMTTIEGRNGDTSYYLAFYAQSRWAHLCGRLFHRIWEPLTRRPVKLLEPILMRLHEAHCGDGCGEFKTPEGAIVRACAYVPLVNRQDLRCYDLQHAGATGVIDVDLTPAQANALGYRQMLNELRRES